MKIEKKEVTLLNGKVVKLLYLKPDEGNLLVDTNDNVFSIKYIRDEKQAKNFTEISDEEYYNLLLNKLD